MSDLVAVCLEGAGENWLECADVLYSVRRHAPTEAERLAGLLLTRYPGCVLVLVPRVDGGWIVRARGVHDSRRKRSATRCPSESLTGS